MNDHWVYLVYGGDELLYVGYTGDVTRRLREHAGHAWWPEDPVVHLMGPYTYEQAIESERWAIKRFDPKYNRTGVWQTLKADSRRGIMMDHPALQAKRRKTMVRRGFWKDR